LGVWDFGFSPTLFLGGDFNKAGILTVNHITRWTGAIWAHVSENLSNIGTNGEVLALEVFDDGVGEALYVAGDFTYAGDYPVGGIAAWTYDSFSGGSWSALGLGGTVGVVNALTVFDDGSGAKLYVGGDFTVAGGVAVGGLARWSGSEWTGVPGSEAAVGSVVSALEVFDDGSGDALYVASNSPEVGYITRWDGVGWTSLSGPAGTGTDGPIRALQTFEDADGVGLFVGGDFSTAGGLPAANLARWDALGWQSLPAGGVVQLVSGSGVGIVRALGVVQDQAHTSLFIGGDFDTADGEPTQYLASWNCLGPIYTDGFESGSTASWSTTVSP